MISSTTKGNLSDLSKGKSQKGVHIVISGHYYLKSLKAKHDDYNFYKGIDVSKARWVHIYAKQADNPNPFSNRVKENFRNQVCPKVLWSGEVKIEKSNYHFEVHQKYGPSLRTLFERIPTPPNEKQLLHLLLQMVKLIERMNNIKLVSGQLDPNLIVFDANPKKNELYLLNCFSLKKRNEQVKQMQNKYCSRGAHLGRNIGIKDDLQSACYILIDVYTQGRFLKDRMVGEYQDAKLSERIEEFGEHLPKLFIDFYYYVIGLNYSDEINFFHWKTYLTKVLTPELLLQPYGFMFSKGREREDPVAGEDSWELEQETCQDKSGKLQKIERVMVNRLNFRNSQN